MESSRLKAEVIYSWSEPSTRHDMRLLESDVAKALGWFQSVAGVPAKRMTFNPGNIRIAGKVPPAVDVEFSDGCMGWEIWIK